MNLARGSGLVLVIDDDADVRTTVRLMLEILGYRVEEAPDGEAALAHLAGGLAPDVVVLDLEMPRMPGAEVLKRLRAGRADLPVVVATGCGPEGVLAPDVEWLAKPFTLEEVGRCVAAALARR